ncbi:DUF3558 family protein [Demequina gelatinilytica]|uniref:DUF3558 family protein n=1 Tax=Demequina gelatinilytica TaxID=1638980 RepID=UPI0007809181|nr:DUF3558 family protein [Demequina gelatinilytica]
MTPRLLPACAAAIAGIVLLAGCTPLGSDASASVSASPTALPTEVVDAQAPEGTVDPCDLIKKKTLSSMVGTQMAAGRFNNALSNDGRNICEWRPKSDQKSEPRVQVEVNWGYPDVAAHRALAEEAFGKTRDVKRSIAGATDAYTTPSRRTLGMSVDEYFVKVSYIRPATDGSTAGDITFEIARKVAKNLASS